MAEVKPPDTFERAVAQMTEIVQRAQVETTDAVKAQLKTQEEFVNAKMSGVEKLAEESIKLFKEGQRATAVQPLSGKQYDMPPLHKDARIDEILRTIGADGPYRDVQDTFDAIQIAETLRYGNFMASGSLSSPGVQRAHNVGEKLKVRLKDQLERCGMKGLDTADIGGGINTGMSAALLGRFLMDLRLAGYFPMFDHPNGVGDFKWPVMTSGTTGYIISETTADITGNSIPSVSPGSQPLLANITFSPKVLGARCDISRELTEDVIFAIIPTVQNDLATSLALAVEYAINSGDTSTTHQDKDVTLSYDARKAWIGLRFKGLAATGNKTDFGSVAFDETQMGLALKKSGKWLVNATERAVISCSPSVWWQMLTQWPSLKYFNLWGSVPTTMQSGKVPAVFNIPIVPSEDWRSLNSVGVVDTTAANNTKTGFVAARTDMFKIGMKRGILLESMYRPEFQAIMLLGTTRLDFKEMRASATYPFVQYGYDITE